MFARVDEGHSTSLHFIGKYSFIETSSPRRKGDNAIMSRMVTLSGKSCLRFYYHMYGADMGTLRVKLCNTVLFEKSGDQGNRWEMHQVRLSGRGSFEVSNCLIL